MGKSWMFRKTNNGHKAGSSSGRKKESKRRYVPIDYARELYGVGGPCCGQMSTSSEASF
jgi:hypothetical protein